MTRFTDYGIVLLTYFARDPERRPTAARMSPRRRRLPHPMVNKILKALTRKRLLVSHRGVKGGYRLAKRPEEISVADIITATEGTGGSDPVCPESAGRMQPGVLLSCPRNWQTDQRRHPAGPRQRQALRDGAAVPATALPRPPSSCARRRGFMSTSTKTIQDLTEQEYKYGFVTDIESETVPRGLNEETIRLISEKKREPEFMLEWRLKAYRHWLTMKEPTWHNVHYPPSTTRPSSITPLRSRRRPPRASMRSTPSC
jgi:Fe-S cluster assembly protein SufB